VYLSRIVVFGRACLVAPGAMSMHCRQHTVPQRGPSPLLLSSFMMDARARISTGSLSYCIFREMDKEKKSTDCMCAILIYHLEDEAEQSLWLI